MTDENQEQTTSASADMNPALPDWHLQELVSFVNGGDLEFPITLFVGGLVVSGQLTSGHKYFEGLGEQLTQFMGGPSENTDKAVKYFTSARDIYTQMNEEGVEISPPQYIHLREARIFTPGQQPIPTEGTWWRGRLACVDGFHFGSLTLSKAE